MKKGKCKKLGMALVMGMLLTVTSVFGYATVTFVMNKTIDQSVTVGNTVQYTEGLIVELESYDNYTLTFLELEETDTSRHYLTYTYNYEILVEGQDIEVSSIGDDIVVTEFVATESSIAITFSLNQEKEYSNGDLINIQFYFEAVDQVIETTLGTYTIINPININTASIEELIAIGFTEAEATDVESCGNILNNLTDLSYNVYIIGIEERFEPLVNDGTLVFE